MGDASVAGSDRVIGVGGTRDELTIVVGPSFPSRMVESGGLDISVLASRSAAYELPSSTAGFQLGRFL